MTNKMYTVRLGRNQSGRDFAEAVRTRLSDNIVSIYEDFIGVGGRYLALLDLDGMSVMVNVERSGARVDVIGRDVQDCGLAKRQLTEATGFEVVPDRDGRRYAAMAQARAAGR